MDITRIIVVVILTIIVYVILAAFTASPIPIVGALLVLLLGLLYDLPSKNV